MNYTGKIRFRVGITGVLILQIGYTDFDAPFDLWRDAKTEDLAALGSIVTDLQLEKAELK